MKNAWSFRPEYQTIQDQIWIITESIKYAKKLLDHNWIEVDLKNFWRDILISDIPELWLAQDILPKNTKVSEYFDLETNPTRIILKSGIRNDVTGILASWEARLFEARWDMQREWWIAVITEETKTGFEKMLEPNIENFLEAFMWDEVWSETGDVFREGLSPIFDGTLRTEKQIREIVVWVVYSKLAVNTEKWIEISERIITTLEELKFKFTSE